VELDFIPSAQVHRTIQLMAPELNQKYRIKSIDKAISILELMALEGRDLTLTERILLPPSVSPCLRFE
jgi:hypothetical protein